MPILHQVKSEKPLFAHVWKRPVLQLNFLSPPTLGMLHSLFLQGNWATHALLHRVTEYAPGQGSKNIQLSLCKSRASHLLLVVDLKGDKSTLITATPLARVTVASLIHSKSATHINTYIHTFNIRVAVWALKLRKPRTILHIQP